MKRSQDAGLADARREALAQARGDVLEIGAGTGLNMTAYPRTGITRLVLTEPHEPMRKQIEGKLGDAPAPTEIVEASAEDLPFDDATFDTVTGTLVLCEAGDPAPRGRRDRARAEARRALPVPRARAQRRPEARAPPGPLGAGLEERSRAAATAIATRSRRSPPPASTSRVTGSAGSRSPRGSSARCSAAPRSAATCSDRRGHHRRPPRGRPPRAAGCRARCRRRCPVGAAQQDPAVRRGAQPSTDRAGRVASRPIANWIISPMLAPR